MQPKRLTPEQVQARLEEALPRKRGRPPKAAAPAKRKTTHGAARGLEKTSREQEVIRTISEIELPVLREAVVEVMPDAFDMQRGQFQPEFIPELFAFSAKGGSLHAFMGTKRLSIAVSTKWARLFPEWKEALEVATAIRVHALETVAFVTTNAPQMAMILKALQIASPSHWSDKPQPPSDLDVALDGEGKFKDLPPEQTYLRLVKGQ